MSRALLGPMGFEHNATKSVWLAGQAVATANVAIGYGYAASDEAEYAVLEAVLAWANADYAAGAGARCA